MSIMNKIINTTTDAIRKAQTSTVNTLISVQKEEAELNSLKRDIGAIDTELNAAYSQIGKKYFECVMKSNRPVESIGADDVMKMAEQKRERKAELEKEVLAIEKRLKDQVIIQEKAKLQMEIDAQIEKLNSAKAMGVLSESEYEEKVLKLRKRLDNFDAIRNVEKQFEMGIITLSEKNEKLADLT